MNQIIKNQSHESYVKKYENMEIVCDDVFLVRFETFAKASGFYPSAEGELIYKLMGSYMSSWSINGHNYEGKIRLDKLKEEQ